MEKKRITRILITAMLVLLGLTSAAGEAAAQQSATIQQSWLTHGDNVNGASGMTMHVKLRTVNLKGVTCMMEVLIFKPNGSLVDTNDRRYAGVKKHLHIVSRTNAAPCLKLNLGGQRIDNTTDERQLPRRRIFGARQIHEMQPRSTGFGIVREALYGFIPVVRRRLKIALTQPHHAAVQKINGRNNHAKTPKKFARSRAPARPERSG